ncbi:diacylglycerol kinase [Microlunatus elymi]|uniref:Diacylglycerol kinase n=1 Tax=Microlunatus elymi TaxID=2596828 RepID=A0A516PX36_9ACTN|nr:diacylglycerol kinase family protein [Microlunatus elymi]QDP95737.1 diacylglycerol kinase [Microlunatus elymi]
MSTTSDDDRSERRFAVVVNPTKISEALPELINEAAERGGWSEPLWLETTADDPGRRMAQQARDAGVQTVLAVGGDGTVRVVASELAGSGVGLGIVPEGTGNLLARNLGIPLTESEAIAVALGESSRDLDIVRISTDDDASADRFTVMAGLGLDAAIMSNTDEALKAKIGSIAYVAAALQHLGREPRRMRITVDDHRRLERRAILCLIGNVGAVQGDIELIPGALPDDGLLDVVVASPRRLRHWFAVALRLITRRERSGDRIDQLTGRRVVVEIDQPEDYELDGDTIGQCRRLVAEIEPGALQVRAPVDDR